MGMVIALWRKQLMSGILTTTGMTDIRVEF